MFLVSLSVLSCGSGQSRPAPLVAWRVKLQSLKTNVFKVFFVDARNRNQALRRAKRRAKNTWLEHRGQGFSVVYVKRAY